MPALQADRCCEGGEPQVEGNRAVFRCAFLFLVGEYLPHAVARRIGVVGQTEFMVFVVGELPQNESRRKCWTGRTATRLCS